jgi:hypothetical protein
MLDDRFNPVGTYGDRSVFHILLCTLIRPAMSRRVVDHATGFPIADATVTVESWLVPLPVFDPLVLNRHLLNMIEVRTDAQGFWNVSQGGMWIPASFSDHGFPAVLWSYCVRADGYSPLVVDPWKLRAEGRHDDMISDVELHATMGVGYKPDPTLSKCGLPLGPPL